MTDDDLILVPKKTLVKTMRFLELLLQEPIGENSLITMDEAQEFDDTYKQIQDLIGEQKS